MKHSAVLGLHGSTTYFVDHKGGATYLIDQQVGDMNRGTLPGKLLSKCGRALRTACDNELIGNEEETPILIQQADAINSEIHQVKTPMQYENISSAVRGGQVNLYDGFRVAVQKQVNLQSVVTHFYWMGSKVNGPIYQYRVILVNDEWMINAGTDLEFNNQVELKYNVNKNLVTKCNINTIEHPSQPPMNSMGFEIELTDNSSASQVTYSLGGHEGNIGTLSYMQALNPYLSLGGSGKYYFNNKIFTTSFGGVFDWSNNVFVAQYDHNSSLKLMYQRRVNPNRVHLTTDYTLEPKEGSGFDHKMSISAEYTLKSSKIHISADSDCVVKSSIEAQVIPGINLQLCAEVNPLVEEQKVFGYGITMG